MRSDGLTWIHVLKTVTAVLLAMGISMRLALPLPRTAMATVVIVMQPQSGLVLAKSFYRFIATIVGSVVAVAITSVFAQQRELFLLSLAIWIGICTFGAARNRNFRSYGFVLSGYTAALVGIPATAHPDGAFLSALTRVSEVSLGIACAGTVSALVFPQHTADAIRNAVRNRYGQFAQFIAGGLSGYIDRPDTERANARFVADVVGLEAMRSAAVFEDWSVRMRAGRLARLNDEFMNVSTRFHALQQLTNRIRSHGDKEIVDSIEPLFREVTPLLTKANREPVRTAADAREAASKLQAFKDALPGRVGATRAQLAYRGDAKLLAFDTAAQLLNRFVDEMHAYTLTYASLAMETHEREQSESGYISKTNTTAAGVAGLRAALAMLLIAAFWIDTAWPSGGGAVSNTAVNCALVATMPRPATAAAQMTGGTLLAAVVALLMTFGVYPHIDGYVLLCAMLAPVFMVGALITARRGWMGFGLGFGITFCILAGPDNVMQYDVYGFINDAIALVLSMVVVTLASAVILPPERSWLLDRLRRDLLRQVVAACTGRLSRARAKLESGTRDLMNQVTGVAADRPDVQSAMLSWMFAVLEVGHAALELRAELAGLPDEPQYAEHVPWRMMTQHTLEKVATLFERPDPRRLEEAQQATSSAIAALLHALQTEATSGVDRHRLRPMLSYLHFIRTSLLDEHSPFNETPQPERDA